MHKSCNNTPGNCFFQISFKFRAYLRIIFEKTKSQVPLGPLLGKQNIPAKEVYWPAFNIWVFTVQLVEHWSTKKAMGSNSVEPLEFFSS